MALIPPMAANRIKSQLAYEMNNIEPISVVIPRPWRVLGRILTIFCLIGTGAFIWRLFLVREPVDDLFLINACVNFVVTPIFLMLFIPFFSGSYPTWVVRIFGAKLLNKLIHDCQRLLGGKRENRATIYHPAGWFSDQRIIWIGIIAGAAILGVLYALP